MFSFNSLPLVGHAKGIIHYVTGDIEKGNKAMYEATRTSLVLGASIAGCAVGPAGAKAAGAATEALCDSVVDVTNDRFIQKKGRKKILNSLPVVGHAKGIFHYVTGDVEKGNKAMYEATITPLALGADIAESTVGAAVATLCDSSVAISSNKNIGMRERKDVSLNSLPVVGHAKGIVHYVTGDIDEGNKAMYEATRTSLVLGASVAGRAVGSAGAKAAGAATEALCDSVVAVTNDRFIQKKGRKKILNSLPVVGHAKGIFHYVTGDVEEGNKAMYEATITPLALGADIAESTVGAAVATLCDSSVAIASNKNIGMRERKDVSLNSLPVVGHAKGIVHYVAGDIDEGNKAMYEATRTSLIIGAGVAGCAAGPAGAAVEALCDSVVDVKRNH